MIVVVTKMIKVVAASVLLLSLNANATTFEEALLKLEQHESVESAHFEYKARSEEAKIKGSWGDPKFKIAAKNFPIDTLSYAQTPMTGVEFGISQKVPLTSKYGKIKHAFDALAEAYHYEAKDKKENLTKAFWEILILKRRLSEELSILNENSIWIEKILKVSKRLYATGKVSQQAILEIQIRKAEIERDISNKGYDLSQIDNKLIYLIGGDKVEERSIPWASLQKNTGKQVDYKELGLQEKLNAKEYNLNASRLNQIPDMTVSLGYTQRSDIDGQGDFISAAITFPIPISDERDSKYTMAMQEKFQALSHYENYKRAKDRDIALISKEIQKLISEIEILDNKIIKFAMNSRHITSKSYGIGNATYIELLQSELKLQNILIHKVRLEAKRDMKRVALKYIKGEPLHD